MHHTILMSVKYTFVEYNRQNIYRFWFIFGLLLFYFGFLLGLRNIWLWDLIKVKSFCATKKTTVKTERQPKWWEKIFANNVTNKRLISKTYKQLIWLNIKITKDPVKKWAEDLNRHFSTEDIEIVKRHSKMCSTSLSIREMQIKAIMRYHLTSIRVTIIKKSTSNKCCGG